jgi:hypothetical protein
MELYSYYLLNFPSQSLVPFLFRIIQSTDLGVNVSRAAGQTLMNIIEFRPKLLAKQQLVPPILNSLGQIIANSKGSAAGALFSFNDHENSGTTALLNNNLQTEDGDDDEDYEDPVVQQQVLAQQCLDTLAIHIPPKHFVPAALALCSQVVNKTSL